LTARALEDAGITTVVIGAALDILARCGTPRTVYNDMPLGNPLGKPFDRSMHRDTLRLALTLAVDAKSPGTVVETPFVWDAFDTDEAWKRNFCYIDPNTPEKYLAMGKENRQRRLDNKAKGLFRE
jgi:D-proline reductase (dithiol) PrdB